MKEKKTKQIKINTINNLKLFFSAPNDFDNNFGETYENENQSETNYENRSETNYENQSEMNYEEEVPVAKNIRVYDMNPDQLYQHMINKFGSKFADEYTPEKYINSNGVPAVKYIKGEKKTQDNENDDENENENENKTDGPIINGFGEESDEEENLF